MTAIEPGTPVMIRTADGQELPRRAVTGVVDGLDFPVVWVCDEDEWTSAEGNGHRPDALPWPAEDVKAAASISTLEPPGEPDCTPPKGTEP